MHTLNIDKYIWIGCDFRVPDRYPVENETIFLCTNDRELGEEIIEPVLKYQEITEDQFIIKDLDDQQIAYIAGFEKLRSFLRKRYPDYRRTTVQ